MADETNTTPGWGKPATVERLDPPIGSFADVSGVEEIRAILRSLEYGQFLSASLLADAMLRDDRIYACTSTRIGGLVGTDLVFRGGESEAAQVVVEEVGGTVGAPGLWHEMFPQSAISELFRWGLFLGIGVGELVWASRDGRWVPRLKIWHPQFVRWQWDTRSYWINTLDGTVELPNTDREIHSDGRWVIYTPYGYRLGWMRSLVRPMAMPYLIRGWTYRDWARDSEVHGIPARKAVVPSDANTSEKRAFLRSIANLGNEPVIECQSKGADNKWDLELVEANAQGFEGFKALIEKAESSIAIALLGHNLTTEVRGGGSYAAIRGGENIRQDLRRSDAITLPMTLRDQGLIWFTRYNFGDDALCPTPDYLVDPPRSRDSDAKAMLALGQAIKSLRDGGVENIDTERLCLDQDVPLLQRSEATLAPVEAPEFDTTDEASAVIVLTPTDTAAIVRVDEARASMDLPRFGDDGDLTIAEFKSKHATVIAEGEAASAGKSGPADASAPPAVPPAAPVDAPPVPPAEEPAP